MNKYYVSLVQSLCGYYIPVMAENKFMVRQWANKFLGKMWCSVYTEEETKDSEYFHPFFHPSRIIGQLVVLTVEDGELYENYYDREEAII